MNNLTDLINSLSELGRTSENNEVLTYIVNNIIGSKLKDNFKSNC